MRPPDAEVVVDGQPARVTFDGSPFDVLNAPRPLLDAYLAGRRDGFVDGEQVGYTRGYHACDEELARLQRAAHRVAQAMAPLEPWVEHQEGVRQRREAAAQRMRERVGAMNRRGTAA